MLLYTENQLNINETNKRTNKLKYLSFISEILTVLMEDYKLILKWSDSFRYEPKSMGNKTKNGQIELFKLKCFHIREQLIRRLEFNLQFKIHKTWRTTYTCTA